MNAENLFGRIKILAKEQGMTIAELEKKVNVSNATISRWQTSVPSAEKLYRVATELGTTTDYLITGENRAEEETIFLARRLESLNDNQVTLLKALIEEFETYNRL